MKNDILENVENGDNFFNIMLSLRIIQLNVLNIH